MATPYLIVTVRRFMSKPHFYDMYSVALKCWVDTTAEVDDAILANEFVSPWHPSPRYSDVEIAQVALYDSGSEEDSDEDSD